MLRGRPFARNFPCADTAQHEIEQRTFGVRNAHHQLTSILRMTPAQRDSAFTINEPGDVCGIVRSKLAGLPVSRHFTFPVSQLSV